MSAFETVFGHAPQARASAPGRANLLGEHTDYNEGFVLPIAIRLTTEVELAVSPDARCRFHSVNLQETLDVDAHGRAGGFASYLYGCWAVLRQAGCDVQPVTMLVRSDVPIAAGLSSSAALEVAALRGLRTLFDLPIDDLALAQLAQQAEVEFAHVRCGILDQMASSLADTEHMLFLDTRTLERRRVPLPAGSAIVILHSGVSRELGATAYNERRDECERAAHLLGVPALRDVADVHRAASLAPPLDRRARHVVSENRRVLEAAHGVDARTFGALMDASHASLRDDFEVSVEALDQLVGALQRQSSVFGARLMGAGFGGACIALVQAGAEQEVTRNVLADYGNRGFHGYSLV